MAELKTKKNSGDVDAFIASLEDAGRRVDSERLLSLMRRITGEEPSMWGEAIVGFGRYQYRYASGREGEWFRLGFSPRAKSLSLYLMGLAYDETSPSAILARLGKHERGKGCLYLKRLGDAEPAALEELLRMAWAAPGLGETRT